MKVETKPTYQAVTANFDSHGRNPTIRFHLMGEWNASGLTNGGRAHGKFEFDMYRNPENKKLEKPRKLELSGIIEESVPEADRAELAKQIKQLLKSSITDMLERINGHVKNSMHTIW